MSQSESEASDVAPDEPGNDSVYDFLYHDARRVGSFLAQFDDAGHLQQVTQSEGAQRAAKRGWKAALGGNLPGMGGANVSLERGPAKGGFEASERVYDPLWTNALTLLDFLTERDMLVRDLAPARIGQFVLVKGSLTVMDLTLFKGLWSLPAVRAALLAGAGADGVMPPAAPAPRNRHEQRAARHHPAPPQQPPRKNPLEEAIDGGLALIGMLPHTIQARIAVSGGTQVVWASLREEALVVSASDLILKHGSAVAGEWNMLGVLDAFPDTDADGNLTPSGVEGAQSALSLFDNPFGNLMYQMMPHLRPMLGRPFSAYGMTPLLVFREVSA